MVGGCNPVYFMKLTNSPIMESVGSGCFTCMDTKFAKRSHLIATKTKCPSEYGPAFLVT
jgi:hypothetical protein